MTPEQKIKYLILALVARWDEADPIDYTTTTGEEIDRRYEELVESDGHWDAESEVRQSGEETGLPCPSSRHYESDAVAAELPDGSWVGWTYWYGGGKHGEPEAIDWIEKAYDVVCTGSKTVVTHTFELPVA